ncbi:hypothetical protein [uncultured Leifsonia sp.]|jgi:hypothetical protein|uniref:hypothetical protein n=1 Tax=uncultured Leifsonia sp. TaxID=340359 RepID=UPI0026004E87|nr:hypothetical protein [uncultured Leifsonia sp.]
MSDRAPRPSARTRRGPNLPLTVLTAIYVVALVAAIVLYFIGIATLGSDPRGAAGYFLFGNAIGAVFVLGGMLHLAVAAVRNVIEDNAR